MKHVAQKQEKHIVTITAAEVRAAILNTAKIEAGYSHNQDFEKEEINITFSEPDKRKKEKTPEINSVEVILINPIIELSSTKKEKIPSEIVKSDLKKYADEEGAIREGK